MYSGEWCGTTNKNGNCSTSHNNEQQQRCYKQYCPDSVVKVVDVIKSTSTNQEMSTFECGDSVVCFMTSNSSDVVKLDSQNYLFTTTFEYQLGISVITNQIDVTLVYTTCSFTPISVRIDVDDLSMTQVLQPITGYCGTGENGTNAVFFSSTFSWNDNHYIKDFTRDNLHSLLITSFSSLIVQSVSVRINTIDLDPIVDYVPFITTPFPYCINDCVFAVPIKGKNFLGVPYKCVFSVNGITIDLSNALYVEYQSYNCRLKVTDSIPSPVENQNTTVQLTVVPVFETSLPILDYPIIDLYFFKMPRVYDATVIQNINNQRYIIRIDGEGFVISQGLLITVNQFNPVGDKYISVIDERTLVVIVPADWFSAQVCMKLIYSDHVVTPSCIEFVYIPTPVSPPSFTDPPTYITPTSLPTSAPSETPVNPIPTPTPTTIPPTIPTSIPTDTPTNIPTHSPTTIPTAPPVESSQDGGVLKFLTENYWFFIVIGIIVVIFGAILFVYKRRRQQPAIFTTTLLEDENLEGLDTNILVDASTVKIDNNAILGKGTYSTVYRGTWRRTVVAVKVLQNNTTNQVEFIQEVSIMLKLRHPKIVSIMGIVGKPYLGIISEYMALGSVSSIIYNENYRIQNHHLCKIALDTCLGMNYLHESNVIHRDLKCGNLLVDQSWSVKVADFGLSKGIEDYTYTMTSCGTPAYIAPEVIRKQHYSYKADVYSFAICLLEMCSRQKPWGDMPLLRVILSVGSQGLRPEIPETVHPKLANVITRCWDDTPESRPSFDELTGIFFNLTTEFEDEIETSPSNVGPHPVLFKVNSSSRNSSNHASHELIDLTKGEL
eukprot:TRINITY_DN132_c1_g2_i1.p1 TRINITY_DN132_c1_g2~~TRINITY_DN132_c1_g2_i1.p1  ORF type:complete len:831 (-),score=177.50 TRINITY_DN132_c1_g2_i1:2010-4502(-)